MGTGLTLGLAAAIALLAVLSLLVWRQLRRALRDNTRLGEELTALRGRLDRVEATTTGQEVSTIRVATDSDGPDYVITSAGLPPLDVPRRELQLRPQVDARQFASLALGESLVRVTSLAYGVRRALSAENRNRIGFEVKREIRRARRRRRRDLKEARRHLRATQREEDAA